MPLVAGLVRHHNTAPALEIHVKDGFRTAVERWRRQPELIAASLAFFNSGFPRAAAHSGLQSRELCNLAGAGVASGIRSHGAEHLFSRTLFTLGMSPHPANCMP